jgi:hypothetical protein
MDGGHVSITGKWTGFFHSQAWPSAILSRLTCTFFCPPTLRPCYKPPSLTNQTCTLHTGIAAFSDLPCPAPTLHAKLNATILTVLDIAIYCQRAPSWPAPAGEPSLRRPNKGPQITIVEPNRGNREASWKSSRKAWRRAPGVGEGFRPIFRLDGSSQPKPRCLSTEDNSVDYWTCHLLRLIDYCPTTALARVALVRARFLFEVEIHCGTVDMGRC